MFNFFKSKKASKPSFVQQLAETNYFEFTEAGLMNQLKNSIQHSYVKYNSYITVYNNSHQPICRKAYYCDSESLSEENGLRNQLMHMKEGLQRLCDFDDLISIISHTTTANSEAATVFDFTKRINDFLSTSNAAYQCYPAYGGNDGSMYLLSDSQFSFLYQTIDDEHKRPLRLDDWWTKYNPENGRVHENSTDTIKIFKVGMLVRHQKLGEGEIVDISDRDVATIKFSKGEKRIILKYAKLDIMN